MFINNIKESNDYVFDTYGNYEIKLVPKDKKYSEISQSLTISYIERVKTSYKFKSGETIAFDIEDYISVSGIDVGDLVYDTTFNKIDFDNAGTGTFDIKLYLGNNENPTLTFDYEVYNVSDTLFSLNEEVAYLYSEEDFENYNFDDYTVYDIETVVDYTKPVFDGFKNYEVTYTATDKYGTQQVLVRTVYVGKFILNDIEKFEYREEYDFPYELEYYSKSEFDLYYKIDSEDYTLIEDDTKLIFTNVGYLTLTLLLQNKIDYKTINESNKKLQKLVYKYGLAPEKKYTDDELKLFENCEYVLTHKKKISNLNEYSNSLNNISEYLKTKVKPVNEEKVNIFNMIESYNKKYSTLLNEEEKSFVQEIASFKNGVNTERKQKFFESLKNECLNGINKLLETSSESEKHDLYAIKESINSKIFCEDTIVKDVAKLLELRDIILDK